MVGTGIQHRLCSLGGCGLVAGMGRGPWHGVELIDRRIECIAADTPSFTGTTALMDILYLLIPLSVVLVFFILGGLWWAIHRGQFEDIEAEGERILKET